MSLLDERVAKVRGFNRFYTKQIGVLRAGLLDTEFSLTQARVLFELAQNPEASASSLRRALSLDAGYLSRLLGGFEHEGLVDREPSDLDGRKRVLRLTEAGRRARSVARLSRQGESPLLRWIALGDLMCPNGQERLTDRLAPGRVTIQECSNACLRDPT